MPRPRKEPIPSSERGQVATAEQIAERLDEFVRTTFGSWNSFEQAAGVPHATAISWKRGGGLTLDSLSKFAEQGLSLDWLVTGSGQMKRRIASTFDTAVIERTIPFLQRAAGIGEFSAIQAFSLLAIRFGLDGLLEKAAAGLQRDFDLVVAEQRAMEQHQELVLWTHRQIEQLERAARAVDAEGAASILAEMRTRLIEHLPADFRPGAPLNESYWGAVAGAREAFIREAATNAGLTPVGNEIAPGGAAGPHDAPAAGNQTAVGDPLTPGQVLEHINGH